MTAYEYRVMTSRGFPLLVKKLDELGQAGWCLAGVVRTTVLVGGGDESPYPVEEFWYYFVREARVQNVK